MRDFSWQCFANTGDVDAYLLYKEASNVTQDSEQNLSVDASADDHEGEETTS